MKLTIFLLLLAMAFPGRASESSLLGDVNGDGTVNISDVTGLIDYLLKGTTAPEGADCNNDGGVNIADVTALIDYLLSGSWPADESEHEWVDLGLPSGTLWATCNVGADNPEEYGDYFAWGETEPKEVYEQSSYKWIYRLDNDYNFMFTKYTPWMYGSAVSCDHKIELDPEDDAAFVNWGSSWHMPTAIQIRELLDNCSSEWTTLNGVNGRLVTGPNGNTMFLPFDENDYHSRYYWSYEKYDDDPERYYNIATCMVVSNYGIGSSCGYRYEGGHVRAVHTPLNGISIEQQSLDLGITFIGDTCTVRIVTIINSTADPMTLTATADEPFAFRRETGSTSSMNVEVPGYSYTQVEVMFNGTNPGEFSGNVIFRHPVLDGGICVIPVQTHAYKNPEQDYVDLGLPSGTLWATRNIGANHSTDFGDFFAWGETEPKDEYTPYNYKWWVVNPYATYGIWITKYCSDYDDDFGNVDNRLVLETGDDAAFVNWGPSWRMPSEAQLDELKTQCTMEYAVMCNVSGLLLTGPNGNTMFLPLRYEGIGVVDGASTHLWSRTLWRNNPEVAGHLHLSPRGWYGGYPSGRSVGMCVRAVYNSQN